MRLLYLEAILLSLRVLLLLDGCNRLGLCLQFASCLPVFSMAIRVLFILFYLLRTCFFRVGQVLHLRFASMFFLPPPSTIRQQCCTVEIILKREFSLFSCVDCEFWMHHVKIKFVQINTLINLSHLDQFSIQAKLSNTYSCLFSYIPRLVSFGRSSLKRKKKKKKKLWQIQNFRGRNTNLTLDNPFENFENT